MVRAIIADDEVLARLKLRQLLRDEVDIEILGECATAAETIQVVNSTNPDLLFLDIRMPDMDGFDVVGALSSRQNQVLPHIVFTTAYDQYAVRAFEVYAIDYLLKPFAAERLRSAIQRVRDQMAAAEVKVNGVHIESTAHPFTTRLVFKSRGRILFLSVEDIRWIEAEENYVRICTGVESHLLRETIGHMETRLDPRMFLRVHRSAIVNLRYVKEVKSENDGDATVLLISGEKIAMSRTYRSRVQRLIHT
jgi:two-component system, LytTR family, response regulator